MKGLKGTKGSVTVEAAVILPIVMSVIISFIFIIKLVHTHVTIQHALNDTANQLATYSYLYSAGGLQKIHDSTKDSLEGKGEQAQKDMELVSGSWDALLEITGDSFENEGSSENILQTLKSIKDAGNDTTQTVKGISELTKRIAANPKEELISIGSLLGDSLLEDGKTSVIKPVVGYLVCKNLRSGEKDADTVLKRLSVVNGLEGLDFSRSTIFKDKKTIDVMVKYKLKLQLPVNILPEIYIIQRSTVRAWLDGEGEEWAGKNKGSTSSENNTDNSDGESDSTKDDSEQKGSGTVWDLSPKVRGKILQTEYGRNLPDMFPTIAKIQNHTAYSIKSIDLTDVTYLKPLNLKYRINGFIKELSDYKQGEYKGTSIKTDDYDNKTLTLIVPKDSLNTGNNLILLECKKYAESLGVTLDIIEHSQKKSED